MKRIFSLLLIALLLLVPALTAQADDRPTYVFVDDGLLTADELSDLNTRAFMISLDRHVGVYYFYYSDVEDLPSYVEQFASEHVAEKNALVLGFNADYYYFLQIGSVAKEALPDSVCESTILDAYRAVKGDPKGKLLAYLNTTDEILKEYRDTHGFSDVFEPEYDLSDVPEEIARTAGGKPTLVDKKRLLTDSEAEALSVRLKEIGDAYRCDVVIVTVSTLGSKTSEAYADDFFDYNGYGYGAVPDANGVTRDGNGILLLLSMEDRDFAISTSGYAITAFTDYGIQIRLEPQFLPYLKNNDWYGGFNAFADGCEELLREAREGTVFDVDTVSEKTASGKPVLVDHAALLTVGQIETLSQRFKALGDRYQCDVILVTDTDVGSDGDAYAERYYREHGYGYRAGDQDRGGILVFYSPAGGQLGVYTEGFAGKAFKSRGLYQFRQDLLSGLYRSDFSGLVDAYLTRGEAYLEAAQSGRAINPINIVPIVLAVVAGALFAFLPVNAMKRKLTDVGKQTRADSYIAENTFRLTQNSDVLLGTSISRTVHVVQSSSGSGGGRSGGGGGFHGGSSTHTSSSGGTHGGHSGKF